MKKKNRLQALAALLAATLTMALTTPVAVSAAAFEETHVGEERTESKVYGGMIAPKTTVATNNEVAYNETNTEATTADSGRIYYLKNSHGDIIGQMDEQGNLLASFAYNAFGELVSAVTFQPEQKAPTNRFLYAGEQYDETSGLYYLRARHYDVSAGRFTQEDTYLGDGRNLYAYVHSNPLKYVDPTGHIAETCKEDDGTFLDDRQERGMDGGVNSPVTVNYNGVQSSVYRGGSSFIARSSDVKMDTSTGNLSTSYGVSVNINSNAVTNFGGAYRVETIPSGVNIIQRGSKAGHYEIVPAYPMTMDTYQGYLNEITVSGPY